MRSVSYYSKSKSNEIPNKTASKVKLITADKKHNFNKKMEHLNRPTRPESYPNDTSWAPSRNWHKYLSGPRPVSPPVQSSPRPKPQSLSPQLKAASLHLLPGFTSPQSNLDDLCQSKPNDLDLLKPPDELVTMKLPKVNFCSGEVPVTETPIKKGPSFNDLCDDDKRKIAQLVEEIARCKQEKQEDISKILELKNEVSELKASLKSIRSLKTPPEASSVSVLSSFQAKEQTALKKQLNELNKLLVEMQVQKATSEVQMKTITEKAERVTRALHAMHRENTELQVELRVTKQRLGAANQAVDRMTKELKSLQDHLKPSSADKSCQSSEDFQSEMVHVKPLNEVKVSEDNQILTELFFNKSLLKNNSNPLETIIFISPDYKQAL